MSSSNLRSLYKASERLELQQLCSRFGVSRIERTPMDMSGKNKAEFFLLGASFSTEEINGVMCNTMVYMDTLYINITEESQWNYERMVEYGRTSVFVTRLTLAQVSVSERSA